MDQSGRKLLVQTLSMLFGFGSWIAMTGLWAELPLLTQKLPERWSLGSYLTIMFQLANIGPLIYWYARVNKLCSEITAIHIQMVIGALSCIVLMFWWDTTVVIGGKERSIALYLSSFGLSIVDCTSSVVFLPYMARFKSHHMTPYLIGEGLSGFLPSLIVLVQGVTEVGGEECPLKNETEFANNSIDSPIISDLANKIPIQDVIQPRFSANVFFFCLLIILLLSWTAFTLMDTLLVCKSERNDLVSRSVESEVELESFEKMLEGARRENKEEAIKIEHSTTGFNSRKYIWLLCLMCWGCFTTFGAMPSIQSYSCLPYGAGAFFYAVTLAGLAYPTACVLGLVVYIGSLRVINILTLIGSGIGVYILVCGIMSPNPPLKTEAAGSVLVILSWVFYVGIISYVKTMVNLELNRIGGNQAMFWCGFAQQFGAASGGAIIFGVVNFTNVFTEEKKCV